MSSLAHHYRSMRSLRLRSSDESSSTIHYPLERLTNLTTLRLGDCVCINRDVFPSMPYLTSLDMDAPISLSQELLEKLAPQLRALTIRDEMYITDGAIAVLTGLKSLSLHNSYQITAASVSLLTQIEHLSLQYYENEIADQAGIDSSVFKSLTNLCSLKLRDYDSALGHALTHLTSLRSLHLIEYNDETTSSLLTHLSQLTRLVLGVSCYESLDQQLLSMTNLKELRLDGAACYAINAATLSSLTSLTSLSINHIDIEDNWRVESLVNLEVLVLEQNSMDYTRLPISLRTLKLGRQQTLPNTIDLLSSLATRLTNLQTLQLLEIPPRQQERQPGEYIARDQAWSRCNTLRALTTVYCKQTQYRMLRLLLPRVDIITIEDDC